MTITARYPGQCAACARPIVAGQRIEWERGQRPRHEICPAAGERLPDDGQIYAGRAGGVRHTTGRNRRADDCGRCGSYIEAGAGRLVRCIEDSGCMEHHDESGWHVYCLDEAACAGRRAEAQAARKAAREAARRASEAQQQLVDALALVPAAPAWVAGVAPTKTWPTVMPHTAACPQLYVGEAEIYYHIPAYFAADQDWPAVHRVGPITPELSELLTTLEAP